MNSTQSVYFNDAGARFTGITEAMWGYFVGSYRPLERWLRERSGRRFVLDYSDEPSRQVRIDEYRVIARAIAAALPINAAIDQEWEQMVTSS